MVVFRSNPLTIASVYPLGRLRNPAGFHQPLTQIFRGNFETSVAAESGERLGQLRMRGAETPPSMIKRAAIYVRVSTANRARGIDGFEQNPEVQEMPLREMVAHRGWTIARVYSDRMLPILFR